MLTVKVLGGLQSHKELGSAIQTNESQFITLNERLLKGSPVLVFSTVRHGQNACFVVIEEFLIFEVSEDICMRRSSVDRSSARAVSLGEVSALNHELGHNAMNLAALVAKALKILINNQSTINESKGNE